MSERIAVIGAGVVGACCAYSLSQAGADVLIVDADRPGRSTTAASFAWVNASAKADHAAYFDLNFAGVREYERLAESDELSPVTWWHPTGHVRWDYGDELTALVETMAARGYPVEVWNAERARQYLEPHVHIATASVVLFGSEGWVEGPAMAAALIEAAARHGAATAFGRPLTALNVSAGAVESITLEGGRTYPVNRIVNAAGPDAADVAALVGRSLPMRDSRGLLVRADAPRDCVRRVIHAPGMAIRPDGPGRVLLLDRGVESELDAQPLDALAAGVCRRAAGVVPALAAATVIEARVGRRAIPEDGLPSIGKASDVAGYFEAVTHSGITLGPIVGRMLANEILHNEVDPLARDFRASRFDGCG